MIYKRIQLISLVMVLSSCARLVPEGQVLPGENLVKLLAAGGYNVRQYSVFLNAFPNGVKYREVYTDKLVEVYSNPVGVNSGGCKRILSILGFKNTYGNVDLLHHTNKRQVSLLACEHSSDSDFRTIGMKIDSNKLVGLMSKMYENFYGGVKPFIKNDFEVTVDKCFPDDINLTRGDYWSGFLRGKDIFLRYSKYIGNDLIIMLKIEYQNESGGARLHFFCGPGPVFSMKNKQNNLDSHR